MAKYTKFQDRTSSMGTFLKGLMNLNQKVYLKVSKLNYIGGIMMQETVSSGTKAICPDCANVQGPKILSSGAGYYIGYICNCGPISRESGYYKKASDAQTDLDTKSYTR